MEKSEFNTVFGEFVRFKRNEQNWSQSRLASELGNNSQNISRIERGEISPTLFWLTKLAEVFNQSISEMIVEFDSFR